MALDLNDKTSNGNNLTNNGAAEYTADLPFVQSSKAAELTSSESDYLSAPDSASLSIIGDVALESWVKLKSLPVTSNLMTFISKHDEEGGVQRGYAFGLSNSGGTKV